MDANGTSLTFSDMAEGLCGSRCCVSMPCQAARMSKDYVMREEIAIGDQVFVADGVEVFGAVRQVAPYGRPELVIYVENAGDFIVPLEAVEAVHSQKVIVNCRKLEPRLRDAIGHAHDAEEPGA